MLPLVPAPASSAPPQLQGRANELTRGTPPAILAWIEQQAREEVEQGRVDPFRARERVTRRFCSREAPITSAESDALLFLMLMAVARLTETLFRDTLRRICRINAESQALRQELAFYVETRPMLKAPPPERAHLRVVPPVSDEHLQALDEEAAAATGSLPTLSEQRNRLIAFLYGLGARPTPGADELRALH